MDIFADAVEETVIEADNDLSRSWLHARLISDLDPTGWYHETTEQFRVGRGACAFILPSKAVGPDSEIDEVHRRTAAELEDDIDVFLEEGVTVRVIPHPDLFMSL